MVVVLVFWFWSPLIKYNIMCLQEMVCRSVDHFVPAALACIAEECADEGLCTQFALDFVRQVDEYTRAKDSEAGDIWLVATPCLCRCHVLKCMCGGKVVDEGGVLEGIVPVAFREIGINKHGVHFVKEGVVYALCYTILLWGVGHCYLMFDPFLLKVLLGVGAGVFTSPISSKCRHLGASLKFSSCNKAF